MPYPVTIAVEPLFSGRNRLTTLFRLILAIPHLILVGGAGLGVATTQGDSRTSTGSETGLLGAVAAVLAIVSWFIIVFTGRQPAGIRSFIAFYLRWRVRALSYLALLQDAYPPFGDAPYPAAIEITDPAEPRDRLSVGFRFILALPHLFVLAFVLLAWGVVTIIAWFTILITGVYPQNIYDFGVGVLRWRLRVEAYMLLMVDAYPPFSLE
jgi:hypothetical protein